MYRQYIFLGNKRPLLNILEITNKYKSLEILNPFNMFPYRIITSRYLIVGINQTDIRHVNFAKFWRIRVGRKELCVHPFESGRK